MSQNKNVEKSDLQAKASDFLKTVKDFAMTVGEDCPEGHRRDARSGACLPMGSTDHTAFTRSLNDDQGDLWRGLKDKQDQTFAAENKEEALLDAADMDAPVSCAQGTTFSFLQRKCVSMEEAEVENNEDFARTEEGSEVYEEVAQNGHEEIIAKDPEGRKDTPGFECPPNQAFDFNLRECIPLNKDTVLASAENKEEAAPITTKQRKSLPDSTFGVPGKRKFPLDTCARVRNAMARFNQGKGLTPGEKAALRRKILAAAKKCGIEVKNFAKAMTDAEFNEVVVEMLPVEHRVRETYEAKAEDTMDKKSPCPPFMTWDPKAKKCMKAKGFIQDVLSKASHQEIIALDPAGRKDTPGFKCQDGYFFDFNLRKCIPLDPKNKMGFQPGDTTKAAEEDASHNDLVPNPAGKPAKLPSDCPSGTIWDKKLERCLPLDTRKKVANVDETAGREGLTSDPAGKVKLPMDCPAGTIWDGTRRSCTPLNPQDKIRQGDPGPSNPKDLAADVDSMTAAQLIKSLDEIIKAEVAGGRKEKSKVDAKDLPNEAFPPSLVASSRRSLMHHTASVADPYDHVSVDVSRLRNSLARINKVEGYSTKAVEEALNHLMEHARAVVKDFLGKN